MERESSATFYMKYFARIDNDRRRLSSGSVSSIRISFLAKIVRIDCITSINYPLYKSKKFQHIEGEKERKKHSLRSSIYEIFNL